jgi:hypothetical protein
MLRSLKPLADTVDIRIFRRRALRALPSSQATGRTLALTPARAALLALMREYERVTFEPPTLVEVQKLAYFLQVNGEALGLAFSPALYGPYASA